MFRISVSTCAGPTAGRSRRSPGWRNRSSPRCTARSTERGWASPSPATSASLADRLAAMPTLALGRTKRSLYASFEGDLASVLETEAEGQAFCGSTTDHAEGVAAFFEKRAPNFVGR